MRGITLLKYISQFLFILRQKCQSINCFAVMEENEPLLQPAIFQAILNKPILVDYNHALEKLDEADLKTQLEQSLQQLPKRCREIFWMSRIEHLSNDEIAQQLSISKRTVENQITHALKHLRLIRGPLFTIMLCTLFQKFL